MGLTDFNIFGMRGLIFVQTLLFIISKYWVEKKTYITVTEKASRNRKIIWGYNYSITLDHYKYAWRVGRRAILDTSKLALVSMPLTGILALTIEELTIEAAIEGDYTKALLALVVHPLLPSAIIARKILDEILEINKEYLVGFY